MNSLAVAVVIGLLSGAHASTWGMYKDAIHEGFTWPKYFRSIVVGALVAVVLQRVTGMELRGAGEMVVFFGMVYAMERLLLELWKSFVRVEDQSKYFIPMRFGIRGVPVMDNRIRWTVGVCVVAVLIFCFMATRWLQATYPGTPAWLVLATIGSAGGWLTAFGGAWKDAPVEGFETFKFFRSPGISLLFAVLVAFFTHDWVHIAVAGAGYSVAAIETYKTFFFPSKPRGKFAGKPILHPRMLRTRQYFVPLYVAIWLVIIGTYVIAVLPPNDGLAASGSPESSQPGT